MFFWPSKSKLQEPGRWLTGWAIGFACQSPEFYLLDHMVPRAHWEWVLLSFPQNLLTDFPLLLNSSVYIYFLKPLIPFPNHSVAITVGMSVLEFLCYSLSPVVDFHKNCIFTAKGIFGYTVCCIVKNLILPWSGAAPTFHAALLSVCLQSYKAVVWKPCGLGMLLLIVDTSVDLSVA